MYLGMTFEEFTRQFQANLIEQAVTDDGYHTKITGKMLLRAFSDFKAFLYILIGGFSYANPSLL